MEANLKDNTKDYLAFIAMVGIVFIILALLFFPIPTENKDLFNFLSGAFVNSGNTSNNKTLLPDQNIGQNIGQYNYHNPIMEDPNSTKEFYSLLRNGSILAALLAGVRFLLVRGEDNKTRMKTWLAGMFAGIASIIACHLLAAPDKVTIIAILIVSPFISTIWPIYERWAKKKAGEVK